MRISNKKLNLISNFQLADDLGYICGPILASNSNIFLFLNGLGHEIELIYFDKQG
jgi:hypothetical protein